MMCICPRAELPEKHLHRDFSAILTMDFYLVTCSNARASLLHQRLGLISSLVTRSASKWEISKQRLDSQCRKISRITCISLLWRKLASSASASSIGGSTICETAWISSPPANGMAKGSPVSPKSQRSNWDSLSDSSGPFEDDLQRRIFRGRRSTKDMYRQINVGCSREGLHTSIGIPFFEFLLHLMLGCFSGL